jgi:hypothetical protein
MTIPDLPPVCPEHRVRPAAGCRPCRVYANARYRRRSRAMAYGIWQPRVDATPTRLHLIDLVEVHGMEFRNIARRSGMNIATVLRVYRGERRQVQPATARKILAVTPGPDFLVDSLGAARRLQAIACAGYTLGDVHAVQPKASMLQLTRWRVQERRWIRSVNHGLVVDLYDLLWDTDGPHPRVALWAANRGWQPFEAWTDDTIDDPDAGPYTAPEMVDSIDWEKLNRAVLPPGSRLRVRFVDLTPAEQRQLYQQHMAGGGSPRGFRDRYRPVPIEILRWLQQETA